jgi:anthranilate/para-aminobenzoate synthase component II
VRAFPDVLRITAETSDGLVMGLRHRELDVEGVQFHPESILTGVGMKLLGTFLARCVTAAAARDAQPVSPGA